MQARLLLSHDIFSLEKKPVICGLGGRSVAETEAVGRGDEAAG